ncbi:lipase 1-like [Trichoplusia ni]|uniref:Lipase n=1 Tax=Trichoplusia ni TaxID=7111 RepID=A0A7E5VJQ7_TRINI|nr:lipase 1-like [Trichoplusia ni]
MSFEALILKILSFLLVSPAADALGNMVRTPRLPISQNTKAFLGYPEDSFLNFTELTSKYGYPSEEHTVVTEDGYILTMFRITKTRNCIKSRSPPILLMHGLLLSAHAWIDSGPSSGLAYLLSNTCYDVWVGNVRGNNYGRRHVTLNPSKDPRFWDFYIEEIGKYDLPAYIDYILDYTRSEKINYIGYSQGGGTFYVMCSERPGYCDKVQLMITLAPATRHYNTRGPGFRTITQALEKLEKPLSLLGLYEVFANGAITQETTAFFCQLSYLTAKLCGANLNLFELLYSLHPGSITKYTIEVLFGHFPAGTSLRNMARYGQSMRSKRFQKFDYGLEQNLVMYGSERPPEYNLSAVTVPVVCLYGRNDGIVDSRDVAWLVSQLPNVLETKMVDDPLWNHFDMAYSQHTRYALFPTINEYLLKFSSP